MTLPHVGDRKGKRRWVAWYRAISHWRKVIETCQQPQVDSPSYPRALGELDPAKWHLTPRGSHCGSLQGGCCTHY